jgi:hypothetical protein
MVIVQKQDQIECFTDLDVFFYYYPLLRRHISLATMLEEQIGVVKKGRERVIPIVHAHPMLWYEKAIDVARPLDTAVLFPDGQTVRMMVYYAIATGGDGYFLYWAPSLSGRNGRERLLASAQAMVETLPLLRHMPARPRTMEFFRESSEVYGAVHRGSEYDVIFLFRGDPTAHHHPSTRAVTVSMASLSRLRGYATVYEYSVLGPRRITDQLGVAQDRPTILLGFRQQAAEAPRGLVLGGDVLSLYVKILQERATTLSENMRRVEALTLPTLTQAPSANRREEAVALLKHIDELDELKRATWLKRMPSLSRDGEVFNRQYFDERKNVRVDAHQEFNFYWRSRR